MQRQMLILTETIEFECNGRYDDTISDNQQNG